MRLPSSLTEPISMGTFFDISGAASKNDRMVMIRAIDALATSRRAACRGAARPTEVAAWAD